MILSNETKREMSEFAHLFAKKLKKIIVPSNDFAGFIGNGHFMRDALFGINTAGEISKEMPFVNAVLAINKVSQELLIRPMGIFQLIDYVGIDVCQYIMKVMNPHLKDEELHSPLLDKMIELEVRGGQNPDGSQKDGFLKYERGKPVGVFNPETKEYVNIADFENEVRDYLDVSIETPTWKGLLKDKSKTEKLSDYFKRVDNSKSRGADLTRRYIKSSREIGLKLVADNVAKTEDDVNKVMLTGFFHLYGPINNYLK